MCLGVPMRIVEIDAQGVGQVEMDGAATEVDLSLVSDATVGDYVIVHAGFAIEMLDRDEAEERIRLFEDLAESQRAAAPEAVDALP